MCDSSGGNYTKQIPVFWRANYCHRCNILENSFLVYSRFKRARRHELSDQNNTFLSFARSLPGVIEADNVRMLETLQHPSLLFKALTLRLGQLTIL